MYKYLLGILLHFFNYLVWIYSFESKQEEFFEEPNENNEAEKNNDKKQNRKRRTRFFAYPSSSVIKDIKDRNLAIAKAAKHSNDFFAYLVFNIFLNILL